jgi:hypothetical protein
VQKRAVEVIGSTGFWREKQPRAWREILLRGNCNALSFYLKKQICSSGVVTKGAEKMHKGRFYVGIDKVSP